jgi:large subunit ribosomal protein L15
MKLHTLTNTVKRKTRKRLGRGHGNNWGRCSGRGEKGQMSRSGAKHRPYFEGGQIPLFRRLPKRGFKNPTRKEYAIINVSHLEDRFDAGDTVDPDSLAAKGMVGDLGTGLKILADGDISKALTVKAHRFSAAAKAKIEAAGGSCELL